MELQWVYWNKLTDCQNQSFVELDTKMAQHTPKPTSPPQFLQYLWLIWFVPNFKYKYLSVKEALAECKSFLGLSFSTSINKVYGSISKMSHGCLSKLHFCPALTELALDLHINLRMCFVVELQVLGQGLEVDFIFNKNNNKKNPRLNFLNNGARVKG